jgi:hypothetical protein
MLLVICAPLTGCGRWAVGRSEPVLVEARATETEAKYRIDASQYDHIQKMLEARKKNITPSPTPTLRPIAPRHRPIRPYHRRRFTPVVPHMPPMPRLTTVLASADMDYTLPDYNAAAVQAYYTIDEAWDTL